MKKKKLYVDNNTLTLSDETASDIILAIANLVYDEICRYLKQECKFDEGEYLSLFHSNMGYLNTISYIRIRHMGELL